MKALSYKVLAVAALAAAVAVPAAAAKPQPQAHAVKLALVPLQHKQIGTIARHLTIAHGSGSVSNSAAAGSANVTPAPGTFKKLGRKTGYAIDYGSVFAGATGLNAVDTSVDEFKTPADAKKGLAFWKKDDARIRIIGTFGIKVTDAAFKAPAFGAARFGNIATLTVPGVSPSIALADLQVADGRYLLDAKVSAGSTSKAEALAKRLAKLLDRRLHLGLAGRLSGKPVKLPPPLKAGPPAGGPDLSTLALQTSDLTGTATVSDSGYQIDPMAVSSYYLDMQPAGSFDTLSQEIEWFSSPNEGVYLGAFLNAEFTTFLQALAGQQNVQPTSVDLSAVGDNAQGTIFQLLVAGQTEWAATVVLSSGHAMDFVEVASQTQIQPSDVQTLAQSAANRFNTGLSAG